MESTYFPRYKQSLAINRKICDHGCQVVFYDKKVLILNKSNWKIMMKGRRNPISNLYMLNLTQSNNLLTEFQTPDKYFAGNLYEWKSKGTLVDYHHASCWSPTQSGWVKSITKNLFTSWPGLSSYLVLKYLNKKQATILGHLQQPCKVIQYKHKKELQTEPEPEP